MELALDVRSGAETVEARVASTRSPSGGSPGGAVETADDS
jgi:hypothetical protein